MIKFKLRFRKNNAPRADTTAAGNRLSVQESLSTSISSKQRNAPVVHVESWNELRKIGAERKQPAEHLDSVLKGHQQDVILQDVQDWDYYIAEFNEQYRQQMKHPVGEQDKDSISTIADTKSQLFRGRRRRMLIYRKVFIFFCLILWTLTFIGCHQWYLTYLIYPMGFLNEIPDRTIFLTYFTPAASWYAFALNAHSWAAGCFGLLCAYCFRENPRALKTFILRIPYLLLVPSLLIFIAVRFVGTFSSQKLQVAMTKKIPQYNSEGSYNLNGHLSGQRQPQSPAYAIAQNSLNQDGKRLWDQLQKILKCCGVDGASDWDSVDNDLTDDVSYWPTTCCPKPFVRREWTKERPNRDDCYYKINKRENTDEYEWAYPEGCLNLAYEFFVKQGAFVVGIMVGNFCVLCLTLMFGFKYYTMIRKCDELKFRYSWKEWFAEIFCLQYFRWVPACFKKICKKNSSQKPGGPDPKKKHKSFASGHQSQISEQSADSTVSIMLGGRLTNVPSVIITAPRAGSEDEEEMHVVFVPDPDLVVEQQPTQRQKGNEKDGDEEEDEQLNEEDGGNMIFDDEHGEDEEPATTFSVVNETRKK